MARTKKRKKVIIPTDPLNGLVVDKQRQHSQFVTQTTEEGAVRAYNLTECNLDVYRNRGYINDEQHYAAIKFYSDFYRAQLIKGYNSSLNVTVEGRSTAKSDPLNSHAYHEYLAATNAIKGLNKRRLVIAVCCMGEWLKDVGRFYYNPADRMKVFKSGLDDLVRHYKISAPYIKKPVKTAIGIATTMG